MTVPSVDPAPLPLARRDVLLWLAVLSGPLAWALDELASYSLAATACDLGTSWLLHLVFVVSLLLALGGAALAHRVGRRLPDGSTAQGGLQASRARFMALAGILLGLSFAIVLVAMEVPNWVLEVCQ